MEVWIETTGELYAVGIGSKIEANALVQYCQAVAISEECIRAIEADGLTVMSERGQVKNQAITIFNSMAGIIAKFASEFGMTPASRGRVKVEKKSEVNEFDEI
mgnify:CR=1 FL=1